KLKGQAARAAYAQEHAGLLKPRLVTITIVVPDAVRSVPDLRVERDGRTIAMPEWGIAVPVDPGSHIVKASAFARQAWQRTLDVREGGGDVVLTVPELAALPVPSADSISWFTRAPTWVWPTGAGGIVSMGIAVGFAVDQRVIQSRIDMACPTQMTCA